MRSELFVVHSYGYNGLEVAELIGSLDAMGTNYSLKSPLPNVTRLTGDLDGTARAVRRLALSLFLCEEISFSSGDPSEIVAEIRKGIPIPSFKSFRVRVIRFKAAIPPESVRSLEREVGAAILSRARARVDLSNPEEVFLLYVTDEGFLFGRKVAESSRHEIRVRENKAKPFKHPSTLQPDLSRALVNIGRVRPEDLVLDPFCGVGGILLEASEIGAIPIGMDFKRSMLTGARGNLMHYGHVRWHLIRADERRAPIRCVDRIVTDPPYGRLSPRISGSTTRELYESLINLAELALGEGGCLAMICPSNIHVDELLKQRGFRVLSLNSIRVHVTLTRVFVSARKRQFQGNFWRS